MLIDLVLRWIHVLSAIVFVGGTLFMRCAYLPAAEGSADEAHGGEVRRRWSKMVAASVALLLIGGLANIARILANFEIVGGSFPGSAYHALFGIKFLLALVAFFLASALAGKSSLAERLRQNEQKWLTLNVVLMVAIVLLAGMLKIADRVPRGQLSPQAGTSELTNG